MSINPLEILTYDLTYLTVSIHIPVNLLSSSRDYLECIKFEIILLLLIRV
jgi:hypothetical protein